MDDFFKLIVFFVIGIIIGIMLCVAVEKQNIKDGMLPYINKNNRLMWESEKKEPTNETR